ncbi:MAG: dihydrofolate reductase family protein [Muribaculaceae bacterium]|nr:dihydrofolate reductase family protein [Muribaculaceae bacterium]
MNRPYIVCHMMQSVDGRVACDMVDKISGDEYYDALESLDCPSHVEGKHSYQIHYCGFEEFKPQHSGGIDKEQWHRASQTNAYSISVDTKGVLLWENTDNDNRLCIVSEKTSPEYLAYLEQKGISYIATGKNGINLPRAMEILRDKFGVERLAVVGGGKINGAFLSAGLIDELSAMIAPGIDGRIGQPALFDGISDTENFLPVKLTFQDVKALPNGVIWARYYVNNK